MLKQLKYLLSVVAGIVFSITVPAQPNLPRLPEDKAIRRGTLASGITYYIIENPVSKGKADIALVRRGEPVSGVSSAQLAPYASFLNRSGISPDRGGFIQSRGGSSVFSFPSVPMYDTALQDSTLLMVFRLVNDSPADEAVIISGDVNAQTLKQKLDIFSLMVPRKTIGLRQDMHAWLSNPAPQWEFRVGLAGGLSTIKATYSAPRLPQNRLNTSQALIPGIFARYFSPFIKRRLERSFEVAGVPLSSVDFKYRGTAESAGNEQYGIQVVTDTAHTSEALNTLALVLGDVDDFGVGTGEFLDIRNSLRHEMLEGETKPREDAAYVERCISHFIYGTNLAPEKETVNLAMRRQLADSTWASLFNSYNSAWLTRLENLNLEIDTALDSLDTDKVIFDYNLNYLIGSTAGTPHYWQARDSLPEAEFAHRVRLNETRSEPVSGGNIWVYSNGMKVIYRNIPSAEGFSYAVLWQGGMDCVDGLLPGEGAFIGNLFQLLDVGDMDFRDFREMLDAEDITMEASLRMKNLIVRGWCPTESLSVLMGALQGIANKGTLDELHFGYWLRSRKLMGNGIESYLGQTMLPDYNLLPQPIVESLSEKTMDKAVAFYKERFSRMNEATIVVIGNVEEQALKKELSKALGGFNTFGGTTPRKTYRYKFRGEHQVMTSNEGERGLHALYQAEMPMSASNYFASMVLEQWLNSALPKALSQHGLSVSAKVTFLAWLQERVSIRVDCYPMPAESLPAGVTVAPSSQWHILLDRALRDIGTPGSSELAIYKDRVSNLFAAEVASTDGLLELVLLRQAYGKNIVLNSKANIASVDAARVRSLMTAISGGSSVKIITE